MRPRPKSLLDATVGAAAHSAAAQGEPLPPNNTVRDVIVVAVDQAIPATRSRTRIGRVSDGDDPVDHTVRHAIGQQPAEAIVVRGDVLHRYVVSAD